MNNALANPPRNCLACAIVTIGAAWLAGCTQTPLAAEGWTVTEPLTIPADDYRRTFEAAVSSLRDHGFLIDRQDYRFGRITAKPRVSPSMFELWNRDNTTPAQSIASTLGDMQRVVTIALDPAAAADVDPGTAATPASFSVTAKVMLERKTNPNRKLTGSADGVELVSELTATPEQYRRRNVRGEGYIEVERDSHYEERLLADIRQRLAVQDPGIGD